MSLDSIAVPVLERGGFRFRKLSVRDRAKIVRGIKERRKAELLARLAGSKIDDPSMHFGEVSQLEEALSANEDGEFIAHLNTADGQAEVLAIALTKEYGAEQAEKIMDLVDLPLSEMFRLVAELCGLELRPREANPEAPPADPPKPADGEPAKLTGYGT